MPSKPRKQYPRIEIPSDLLDKRDQRLTSGYQPQQEVVRRTLENLESGGNGDISVGQR